MCQDQPMTVKMTGGNEGCEGPKAIISLPPCARSVLERGTTVPLSGAPLANGAGAHAKPCRSFGCPLNPILPIKSHQQNLTKFDLI